MKIEGCKTRENIKLNDYPHLGDRFLL